MGSTIPLWIDTAGAPLPVVSTGDVTHRADQRSGAEPPSRRYDPTTVAGSAPHEVLSTYAIQQPLRFVPAERNVQFHGEPCHRFEKADISELPRHATVRLYPRLTPKWCSAFRINACICGSADRAHPPAMHPVWSTFPPCGRSQ